VIFEDNFDIDELRRIAEQRKVRDLTPEERRKYLGQNSPNQESQPDSELERSLAVSGTGSR
jgi:hypothetical protein